MPEEPIVFIEAALTRGIPKSIHEILEWHQEHGSMQGKPDTAVFYSINNTQEGLAGLGLGKILIFDVIESVLSTETAVKRFCTISPVPGLWPQYVRPILRGEQVRCAMSPEQLLSYFPEKTQAALRARHAELSGRQIGSTAALLLEILQEHKWIEDPTYRRLLRWPLTELTYYYITKEKNSHGRPLNPVAGFHLGNGATVSPGYVRFAANRSERGMEDSCGMMVNYLYSRTLPKQTGSKLRTLLRRWRS